MSLTLTMVVVLLLVLSLPLIMSPVVLALLILSIATPMCLFFGASISPWFSMALVIIYIGGLLVMFAYIISLLPNEKISWPAYIVLIFGGPTMFLLSSPSVSLSPIKLGVNTPNLTPTPILLSPSMMILMLLVISLLVSMIAVVTITSISKGPVRPFN